MDYKITYSIRDGIIEITISGQCTSQNVGRLTGRIIKKLLKTRLPAVLVDLRKLRGRPDFGDAFFRVRQFPSELAEVRAALVDSEENREFAEFFSLTASNAGCNIRFFTDLLQARAWLKSS